MRYYAWLIAWWVYYRGRKLTGRGPASPAKRQRQESITGSRPTDVPPERTGHR